MAIRHYSGQAV